jgi:uncharacterized protein (TIGR03435 family)
MLQSLLEDWFPLKAHRETKELPSYTLIPAKKGVKLASPKDGGCRDYATSPLSRQNPEDARPALRSPPCGHPVTLVYASGTIVQGRDLPVVEFIKMLWEIVGRPVIHKTGVTENFDVHLEFSPGDTTPGIHTTRRPGDPGALADPRQDRRL